jgi:integrase
MAKVLKVEGKKGVSWRIDYLDPDGNRIRKMFRKKKDADAELAARINAMDDRSYREEGHKCTTTLEEMIGQYGKKFGKQKSFGLKLGYLRQFERFIGKDTLLSNITYADIDRYMNHLRDAPTYKGTPHTRRGINAKYSAICQMFKYAADLDKIKSNPLAGKSSLRKTEDKNTRQRFLSEGEIIRLLKECQHNWDMYRRLVWALNTGMDHEDIQRVTWGDITKDYKL